MMVWSTPVRISDLVKTPAEVVYADGARIERYDFSNQFVTAAVERQDGGGHWEIRIATVDSGTPRHGQDEVARAVKLASDVVMLLNKPVRSVAADEALSDEVRVIIAERGWTFREAAAEFGIELARFGNLVCGQTRWTVTDLFRIAEVVSEDADEEFARLASIGRRAFVRRTAERHRA